VNIPSMPSAYMTAVALEINNSVFGLFGITAFEHELVEDYPGLICSR
jgi:hypothetical protein